LISLNPASEGTKSRRSPSATRSCENSFTPEARPIRGLTRCPFSSQSFRDGDYLFEAHLLSKDFGFGCAGGNRSSHLTWSAAPRGTKSFAVTCHDPDAPTGSGFWHWLVVNIPATSTVLQLDAGNPQAGKKVPSSRFDLSNKGIWGAMSFSSTSQLSIGAVS
jgi:phosphatidylethanolamine-binding protein (PEBP) family uncharacterized protein